MLHEGGGSDGDESIVVGGVGDHGAAVAHSNLSNMYIYFFSAHSSGRSFPRNFARSDLPTLAAP